MYQKISILSGLGLLVLGACAAPSKSPSQQAMEANTAKVYSCEFAGALAYTAMTSRQHGVPKATAKAAMTDTIMQTQGMVPNLKAALVTTIPDVLEPAYDTDVEPSADGKEAISIKYRQFVRDYYCE